MLGNSPTSPIVTFRLYAPGIIPNPDMSGLDNSTYKIQFTVLLNFESHYHLRFEHHGARSQRVSLGGIK